MDIHTEKDSVTNDETDKSCSGVALVPSLGRKDATAALLALRTHGTGGLAVT